MIAIFALSFSSIGQQLNLIVQSRSFLAGLSAIGSPFNSAVGLAIFFGNEFSAGEIVQRFPRV
jgi:hypothetical protein